MTRAAAEQTGVRPRGLVMLPTGHDDDGPEVRPLDYRLIARLLRYTKPYAAKRNWLFFLTITRSIQLPLLPWLLAWVLNKPIAHGDVHGLIWGALGLGALAALTQFTFHFRQRLALELGESVVHDMRRDMFAHLQSMNMSYFGRTKLGRIISRVTSDIDSVRTGVQDVMFMAVVQVGQMLGAAAIMAYTDYRLFMVLLALAPILYAINHFFRV
jgi:ATP-binding cassette subfamily B protein